jgi:outer membrane receptor protein involved in Fe transport
MAEVNLLERLRLMGGARVESYALTVNSENQLGQASVVERDYTDILPAVTAIVGLSENQQLRLAASRTLARPEYRELAPITYREVLGGEQVIGNSELERTLITNLDARWEWYPSPGEIFSVGVFASASTSPSRSGTWPGRAPTPGPSRTPPRPRTRGWSWKRRWRRTDLGGPRAPRALHQRHPHAKPGGHRRRG